VSELQFEAVFLVVTPQPYFRYIITEFPGPSIPLESPATIALVTARSRRFCRSRDSLSFIRCTHSRRLLFAGIRSRIFLREINNSSPAPTRPSKFVRDAITRAALRRRYVSAQTRICRRGDGIRRDRRRGEERSRAGNTSDHPGNRPG